MAKPVDIFNSQPLKLGPETSNVWILESKWQKNDKKWHSWGIQLGRPSVNLRYFAFKVRAEAILGVNLR